MMTMTMSSDHISKIADGAARQGWPAAWLERGALRFTHADGFEQAARTGFFFIAQPEVPIDLTAGDHFARHFHRAPYVTGDLDYRLLTDDVVGRFQGYYVRDEDQTEQFFLESKNWSRYYPLALANQAQAMRDLSLAILRATLTNLPIPSALVHQATGGALTDAGTNTLTFNHFRPEIGRRGLNIHKDSGWVTLLRSLRPGLEVLVDDEWRPITPIEGTFIVNFGCAMEILTQNFHIPVVAASHRVVEQRPSNHLEDRFSYALFVDSSLDPAVSSGLHRFQADGTLAFHCSFETFLTDILANTYRKDGRGLY